MKHVDLYTDGACLGNPGVGGWAAILVYKGQERVISGSEDKTTNNRMELTAVIEGLSVIKEKCEVFVYTDSKYVVDAINKCWINNWAENSFFNRRNSDLWLMLWELLKQHNIEFIWIKGHNGHPYNEKCDAISVAEAQKLKLYKDAYKKITFATEAEAIEWCNIHGIRAEDIRYTNYGVDIYYIDQSALNNICGIGMEDNKEYVIGALCNTGTMYVSPKGTTFYISQARRFTKDEASNKAKAMRKNSRNGYEWKHIKV